MNLKTNGTVNIKLYSDNYTGVKPDIIIINNSINYTKNEINNTYNFSDSENNINNITLIWDNLLTSTKYMFFHCENIIEIDLSNFNTSSVTIMKNMFYQCKKLIFLNLTNS